ncbi:PQ-loop repeat-containing protein [Neobacillus mesonae]|uniref:PQ-loop repeat-containing protein n=1 Tax=Neobacillus mesonae TaxID=1193713 RepID=UPI0033057127
MKTSLRSKHLLKFFNRKKFKTLFLRNTKVQSYLPLQNKHVHQRKSVDELAFFFYLIKVAGSFCTFIFLLHENRLSGKK